MFGKLNPLNGGHFISRGKGMHPCRVIDSDELIFVVSGTLMMFEAERRCAVPPGGVLLLRAGRRHGGAGPYARDLSFFWIHFQADQDDWRALSALIPGQRVADPARMAEYCRFYLNVQQDETAPPDSARLLLALILGECLRTAPTGKAGLPPLLTAAEHLIAKRYSEPDFSVAALAAELGCNADYLSRLFRRYRHMSCCEAIGEARIAAACRLLRETGLRIKEICYSTSYQDPAHFRRQFFRRRSLTPGMYRKHGTAEYRNFH